jgi:cyclophilin family peptidyl-prolyl cis-trans isomerase
MARTGDPHSATAQFFINVVDNAFSTTRPRDGWGYAVFGKVVKGMDVVQKIAKVPTGDAGPTERARHADRDRIVKLLPANKQPNKQPPPARRFQGIHMIKLHTNHGVITLELDAEKAPETSPTSSPTSRPATTTTRSSTASSTAS